jgi:CheY-like chemotaxis protein
MDDATNHSSFSHERIKVLLYVEDDDNDRRMFLHAARKLSARLDVRIVKEGQHAIEWLSGTGVYAERNAYPLPDLVLVDLRMPGVNGFDLLRWVRSRPEFENVPVIVYSDWMVADINQICKELGATNFIGKGATFEALNEFLYAYATHPN